ncbi:MAG TPA: hypothetical protein VGP89_03405 [Candidatus Angelobacter sp.]|jgi:hypothetical protein|nr:hypothetical protein [Candidatus Angelobacter sp.]
MSRLDELSKGLPDPSLLDDAPEIVTEGPAEPNIFTQVTVMQLYEFAWKCFFAALLFALPFLTLYGAIVFFSK